VRAEAGADDGWAVPPRLTAARCPHSTLTPDPDMTLLGLSDPNERDAASAGSCRDRAPTPAGHSLFSRSATFAWKSGSEARIAA
jgi:hypothetical protein